MIRRCQTEGFWSHASSARYRSVADETLERNRAASIREPSWELQSSISLSRGPASGPLFLLGRRRCQDGDFLPIIRVTVQARPSTLEVGPNEAQSRS